MEYGIVVVAFGVSDKDLPSREPQPPARFRMTTMGDAVPRVGEFVELPGTKFVGVTFLVAWRETNGHGLIAEVHVMVHATPSARSDLEYQLLAGDFQRDGWPTPFEVEAAPHSPWWDRAATASLFPH